MASHDIVRDGESRGHLGQLLSFLYSWAGRRYLQSPVSISSPSLQSRMVRNETPYLIWTTRRDVLDCRFLSKDQMINHYARAGSFTTKVGIPGNPTPALGLAAPLPARLISQSRFCREHKMFLGSHLGPELYLTCVDMMTVSSIPMECGSRKTLNQPL